MAEKFTSLGQTLTNSVVSTKDSGTHTLKLNATLNSIDNTNFTANVTLKCILITKYISWSGDRIIFSVGVNDVEKNTVTSGTTGGGSGTVTKEYVSWTGDIPYNTDGTLTATLYARSADQNSAYAPPNKTVSITAEFPSIALPSTCTLTGSNLGSAVTVNIARQLSTFTHKIEYSFAGSAYSTPINNITTASTTITPGLSLASNIPNSTTGELRVRLTTYNSTTQDDSTKVGSPTEASIQLSLPASVVPSINSFTATAGSSNSTIKGWGLFVKGYSTAALTIGGAAGIYGSTIKSYAITSNPSGISYNGTANTYTTGILNSAGTITFTATVTDSRGRTASKPVTITVQDYQKPSINVTAFRCDSSGNAAEKGTSLRVTATYSCASIKSGNTEKNSISSKSITCNGVSNTSFSSGTAFTFAANVAASSSYNLTATVKDAVGETSTAIISIANAEALPLHIKGNKKGIGLGTMASTDSTIEVGWPIDLNGNKIEGLVDLVYPVGAIYMSVNSTSPATLFGGTWSQLGGQFLLAASSTYAAGSTGGAATVSLATANLPSHTHSVNVTSTLNGAHTHTTSGTAAEAGTHSHVQNTITWYNVKGDGYFPTSGTYYASSSKTYSTQDAGAHTHTVSGTAASNGAHTHTATGTSGSQGSGTAHDNMPPYLAVYMWKRTA